MKVFIILTLAAAAQAAGLLPVLDSGLSTRFHKQDDFGNYGFGYKEDHLTGGTFREETGDVLGRKVGSYGLTDADGRVRVVSYVADDLGFRAKVDTNEPGVGVKDPADVLVNKDIPAPVVLPKISPVINPNVLVDPLTVTKVDSFFNPLIGSKVIVDPLVPKVAPIVDTKVFVDPLLGPKVAPIIDPQLAIHHRHHLLGSAINPISPVVGPSLGLLRRHHLLGSLGVPKLSPIVDAKVLIDPLLDLQVVLDPHHHHVPKVSTVLDHRVTVDPVVVPRVSSLLNKRVTVDPLIDPIGKVGLYPNIPFSSYGLYNKELPLGYLDYYNKFSVLPRVL